MTTDQLRNYLTINRGSVDGIQQGQGIRNAEGVVGIVKTVGYNYSVVLPLINIQTNLSCRFTKNDYIATLQWNGKDCRFAQLADVAAHMVVNPGDTIVTSGLSPVFPEGIPVGIVESSVLKDGESYHRIRVRLHTNFKRLKYVEVVQNAHQTELEQLEDGLE
jgi:rod shape-determining protein MreC